MPLERFRELMNGAGFHCDEGFRARKQKGLKSAAPRPVC
jgi:hypothetical protein